MKKRKETLFCLNLNILYLVQPKYFSLFWITVNIEYWIVKSAVLLSLEFASTKAPEPVDVIVSNQSHHTRQVNFITPTHCMILFLSHVLCLLSVPGFRDKDVRKPCVHKVLQLRLGQDGTLGWVPKIMQHLQPIYSSYVTGHVGRWQQGWNYLWLRNISCKYRIKANSESCHSGPLIALYFTGGRVKYFEQKMEMKENERGVIEGPGRWSPF